MSRTVAALGEGKGGMRPGPSGEGGPKRRKKEKEEKGREMEKGGRGKWFRVSKIISQKALLGQTILFGVKICINVGFQIPAMVKIVFY